MKLKILSSFLLFVFLCVNCTDAKLIEKPKNLLPVDQIEDILVDMYIYQQSYQVLPLSADELRDITPMNSNKEVLDKHKVKVKDFEDSFKYYSVKTTVYNKILDGVEKKLKSKLPAPTEKSEKK